MTKKLPLVLCPGLLCDAALWAPQVEALRDVAEVFIPSLAQEDTMSGMGAAVLREAPWPQFARAGLSMGGYVALEIMRQARERVTALALMDTQARSDSPEASAGRRALVARSFDDFDGVIDSLFPRLVHPARAQDAALKASFTAMAQAVGPEAFRRQQAAIMTRIDSRPFLPRIACPTLVLCGRDDGVTPVALHEEMADAIPGARLEVLEDCGHLSAIERPEAVTAALRKWLA